MSYLIRKGFADKHLSIDRSLILPEFEKVAIVGESADWAKTTFGLGSLLAASQVLLAGYAAVRIKYNLVEEISPHKPKLVEQAWHLLGGYIEEYSGDDLTERDERATEWLKEFYEYVEERLRIHWISVEALATALLQSKVLPEAKAFGIIEKNIPMMKRFNQLIRSIKNIPMMKRINQLIRSIH